MGYDKKIREPELTQKEWDEVPFVKRYPVWAEIELSAILHNINEIRRQLSPAVKLMAVIKANAYGHGAVNTAYATKNKVDYFGVSRIMEALELREAGINTPVLIFGYAQSSLVDILTANNITQTVYDYKMAKELSDAAVLQKKKLKVHIKVDTGMCRVGIFVPNIDDGLCKKEDIRKAVSEIEDISRLPGLEIEGIYTHFSSADSFDLSYTESQLTLFNEFNDELVHRKIFFEIHHAANSAAMLNYKKSHLDMVRPGIAIYGISPSCCWNNDIDLKPAMQIKALVAHVKRVPKGSRVSYSGTYITPKETIISTIPIGYADGYRWRRNPYGNVLIHGEKAPIIGRICMDFLMADTTHIKDVAPGDEVVILGTQGNAVLSASEVALSARTIPYEILSSLTARIKRAFK